MENIRLFFYRDGLSLDDCFTKAFKQFILDWGDFESPEGQYKDFINCWGVVEAYFKEYPPADDYFQPLMKEDGSPAVEFTFALPLELDHPHTGLPLLYSGRIDLLSEPLTEPGNVWAVDEKTTRALGPSWQYQWDMRGQFLGYTRAARAYGYNCPGALVRGMAIQQTKFAFQEKPLFFTEYELSSWWDQVHVKTERMLKMYEYAQDASTSLGVHQAFDKSYADACTAYGGCPYVLLCKRPDPWTIYESFETRVWDPLAKDPTAGSEDRLSNLETQSLAQMMEGM